MYKLLTDKGQLFALSLGIVAIAIAMLSIVMGIKGAGYNTSDDLNAIMKQNPDVSFDFFNPAITVVMILILVALVSWIAFSVWTLVSDPKGSIKFLIGLGGVLVLFFIMYATSDAETTGRLGMLVQKFNVSEGVSKLISGGVKTAVLGIVVGFIGAAIMEIINLFK
jgi:hypothetical protein